MASASDFATAFAKAERAAGRPLPTTGTVFVSVRDADKRPIVPVAAALLGLGFRLVGTSGTAEALSSAGLTVDVATKVSEAAAGGSTVVDLIRRGRCDLVLNTPQESGAARSDGYLIREAALAARVPCVTTIAGAAACVEAIAHARADIARSLQERHAETRSA
jgi:carbamoyl-phosphate synthase large subunit